MSVISRFRFLPRGRGMCRDGQVDKAFGEVMRLGDPVGGGEVHRAERRAGRASPGAFEVLMTSLATELALVPLIVLPGHQIEYPLATVIVGGLITSTLLTLFVVPSLYLRLARPCPAPGAKDPAANEPAPA